MQQLANNIYAPDKNWSFSVICENSYFAVITSDIEEPVKLPHIGR